MTDRSTNFDTIIVGAGAAGLMCAMTAGARGRNVLLIEHMNEVGKKILISGGGRCNFTNLHAGPENFISANPHFCKSALAGYTQHDFIALVEKHKIAWHEKTLGQLFCDESARQIVKMLLDECATASVDIKLSTKVTNISRSDHFTVTTDKGTFSAPSLVLASGGLSIPKMGAGDFAHRWANKFGLDIVETRPALVPLTLAAGELEMMQPLSGVATPCIASIGKTAFREAMLVTHRGLSGPAILQISSYWRDAETLRLNVLPDADGAEVLLNAKRSHAKSKPKTALANLLPTRLADALCSVHLPEKAIGDISDAALRSFGDKLNRWDITPNGTEGYKKAEVTAGGIDTDGLHSKTLAARDVPGLFVIGEAVDVTGWLGGYNFQWAWASGHAAGKAV